DADLSTLYRIADGGLTPLTGPMTRDVFDRVLQEEVITDGGRKFAWTIPLAFPLTDAEAKSSAPGQTVALVNSKNEIVGTLDVEDVYPFDTPASVRGVYATDRTDHPGARIVTEDPRSHLAGGTVRVLPQPKHPEYGQFVLSP